MRAPRSSPSTAVVAAAAAAALAVGAASAFAADAPAPLASAASAAVRHLDPARPPAAVRAAAVQERRTRAQSSSGAGLNAEVAARLRESFDAADRAHRGALTKQEAQAGGFGWLAQRFDAVDTAHAGEVRFEDVQRYLRLQGARYVDR